jgi:hypothetical protein
MHRKFPAIQQYRQNFILFHANISLKKKKTLSSQTDVTAKIVTKIVKLNKISQHQSLSKIRFN